ncbi:MAG: YbhB/YbcL family Raf kinase inhibitor-like protein [Thermomicrobiales bacterium]|nr:YbhB/YbcL family Raf kinase inhibitor-like protein [Thermomicrobiales bacterium]
MSDGPLRLTSSVFVNDGPIPADCGCDGAGASPPLAWTGAPSRTASFALIVEDPDARSGPFTHWLVYDLPADSDGLPANVPRQPTIPGGGAQGENGFHTIGYGPPCPPRGEHRYVFRLFALDALPGLPPGASRDDLSSAIAGHVVAEARLTGTYAR